MKLCCLLLFVCLYLANAALPKKCNKQLTFVNRAQWAARQPTSHYPPPGLVDYVVVHHTDTTPCYTLKDCVEQMKAIQNNHIDDNGWDDIGFNLVIGGDERVYVGRGWNTIVPFADGPIASDSVAIAIIGNYTSVLPSDTVLEVLKILIEFGVKSGYVNAQYGLVGHRDAAITGPTLVCPGDALYAEIQTWPHYFTTEPESKVAR